MNRNMYLITGGTGTIGKEITRELLNAGKTVRILTRDASKAQVSEDVEIFEGDLRDHETLRDAIKGVQGIHFISFGDWNYTPLSNGKQLLEVVEDAGISRITVLYNGEGNESSLEKEVKQSNLDWTIFRPQEYMANAKGWSDSIRERNAVEESFGNRPTAVVHEGDIGAVMAKVLINGGHSQKTYSLTGPEALTPRKQVQQIGAALDKEITFNELDGQQARDKWKKMGFTDETIDYLHSWYSKTPAEGYTPTSVVEDILGRPPRTFKEWVRENINSFAGEGKE